MRFRLFGIPVEVQPGFWLMAAALGLPLVAGPHKASIAVWVAVVFVSIMVHEFGHALAIIRYGGAPGIVLHMLGGLTKWGTAVQLRRRDHIIVSAAGPVAGFILAGVLYVMLRLTPISGRELPYYVSFALEQLFLVNIIWGLFNLIPVLPFDGGHILEAALGPKRRKTTALVSLIIGGGLALLFLVGGYLWVTFIVGLGALQSYQRLRAEQESSKPVSRRGEPEAPKSEPLPADAAAEIASVKYALDAERPDKAAEIAETILATERPPRVRAEVLHLLAWAYLMLDQPKEALRAVGAIEAIADPDVALVSAVLLANGDEKRAAEVLEQAHAAGDERKEISGPLIQILIARGEVRRAAAIALQIVEWLSEDDARKMAEIASEGGAHDAASRLNEVVFERTGQPEDAYTAARDCALAGDDSGALELLRRAVAAGFSDAARVWSDAALEKLQAGGELDALLPRPTTQ